MRTSALTGLLFCALAGSALADFSGQPIVGALTLGSSVTNSTAGESDDNDGWDSGIHIFDIWDGGDDVFTLDWAGGTMIVTLTSLDGSDNDLFIYSPSDLDSAAYYSFAGAFDQVTFAGAGPGTYYINIDSTLFSEGDYRLEVTTPTPGAGAICGIVIAAAVRRRRR